MKKLALTRHQPAHRRRLPPPPTSRAAPVKAPAPAPVAVYNWTGCYVGAGGGYGMWNQETQYVDAGGVPSACRNDNGGRGWFGTVQVGCDYQFGSNIVIGAFGDYDFSGIKGDMSVLAAWLRHRRGEAQELVGGRRPYRLDSVVGAAAPGLRLGRLHSGAVQRTSLSLRNDRRRRRLSSVPEAHLSGWFLGSGYEYGLGFVPGLFWKTEYRFCGLRQENVRRPDRGGVPVATSLDCTNASTPSAANWSGASTSAARWSRATDRPLASNRLQGPGIAGALFFLAALLATVAVTSHSGINLKTDSLLSLPQVIILN